MNAPSAKLSALSGLPWGDIGATVLIVAVTLGLRWLIVRHIRGDGETISPDQRRWIAVIRNVSIGVILVSLVLIWALEISKVALSVAAFAVAIVLAGKELILCLSGGVYRALARPFGTGDWIAVGTVRGEVLSVGIVSVELKELAPEADVRQAYTGRTISLPNSMLLGQSVQNLTYTRKFDYHTFHITAEAATVHPSEDLDFLRQEVAAAWSEYEALAVRYWSMIRRQTGVDLHNPQPEVNIGTTELGHVSFQVRIYCQRHMAGEVENRLVCRVLERWRMRAASQAETTESGE